MLPHAERTAPDPAEGSGGTDVEWACHRPTQRFQTPCFRDELVRTPYHLEPDAVLLPWDLSRRPDHPARRPEENG